MTRKNVYVIVNGNPLMLSTSRTVAEYLRLSGYEESAVVTLNGHILSGRAMTATELHEGDIVEVGTFAAA